MTLLPRLPAVGRSVPEHGILVSVEADPGLRDRGERLKRLHQTVEALLNESGTILSSITSQGSPDVSLIQMDRNSAKLAEAVQEYREQSASFLDYLREQARKIEESNRKAAMAEKRSGTQRDQAKIQELSEELTRDLRLERVDKAMKELLDFLSDDEFFAENASTGRRRRLRTLQNAINKALEK